MSGNAGARAYELLRRKAREIGADLQSLATSYAIERFMARLSRVDEHGNITVKGGQSLGILFGNRMRPTKDLDINISLEGIDNPEEWIRIAVLAACNDSTEDGVSYDAAAITIEQREHQGDGGLRVTMPCSVHTCRTPFMIDIGIGNEITFLPSKVRVAGILGDAKNAPEPLETLIYPHENTLAEKIVSKIEDGISSIRHKDFFDIWLLVEILRRAGDLRLLVPGGEGLSTEERMLAESVREGLSDGTLLDLPETEISRACLDRLGLALRRTADHRGTELPENLHSWFMDEFGGNPMQSAQWANWCRNQKNRLLFQPPGTEKQVAKENSLGHLIDNIGPLVDEIARIAHMHCAKTSSPGL